MEITKKVFLPDRETQIAPRSVDWQVIGDVECDSLILIPARSGETERLLEIVPETDVDDRDMRNALSDKPSQLKFVGRFSKHRL
jgi:hypothetical protein